MRVRFWKRTKTDRPPASTLVPPEGVALTLPIAGVGVRFSAQLIDIILTAIAATCLVILLALINLTTPQTLMAIAALLFFLCSALLLSLFAFIFVLSLCLLSFAFS